MSMPMSPMDLCEFLEERCERLTDALHRLVAECVESHWPMTADQRIVLDHSREVLSGGFTPPHEPPLTAD